MRERVREKEREREKKNRELTKRIGQKRNPISQCFVGVAGVDVRLITWVVCFI